MGKVLSVNISKDKQEPKKGIYSIDIDLKRGVIRDAHEGASMQVSILAYEAVSTELGDTRDFPPGCFAENITTQGIDLSGIKVGDQIKAGKVILKVVQLGKPADQSHTYSFKGHSLLPKHGIFANVIKPGRITRGDKILIIKDTHSDENLYKIEDRFMSRSYLENLYDLAKELNQAKNITATLDIITDHLPRVLKARYCSLFIKNPTSYGLELKAHNHKNIGNDPFINITSEQESIMNLALARNSSLLVKNIEEEIGIVNKEKYSTKSFISVLIKHGEEIKGVLNLADKKSGSFNNNDMLVLSTIAELLGALFSRVDLSKI